MNELWLRLHKNLDGDELQGSVYAELSGTGIKGARRFMIPTGMDEIWYKEPIESGRFLVQVRLPSGDVLSRDISVPADAPKPTEVVIKPEPSAHEHLAWPQLLGSIDEDLGETAFYLRTLPWLRHRGTICPHTLEKNLKLDIYALDATGTLGEPIRMKVGTTLHVDQKLDAPGIDYTIRQEVDEENIVVRFIPSEVGQIQTILDGRLFFRLSGLPGGPWIVSLPLQWRTVGATTQLDILWHHSSVAPAAEISTASVIVRDPVMGLLLAYLASGQMTAVREMRDTLLLQAEDLLYRKKWNPYAAATGALVLIRTCAYERLHGWTIDLANWFPWLADGAAIHGWCCLLGVQHESSEKRTPDIAQARQYFLEAARRGVPVLSDVLRLIIDGLKRCQLNADQDGSLDAEVEAALVKMRGYAVAIDWHQPFTVFSGTDPLTPKIKDESRENDVAED